MSTPPVGPSPAAGGGSLTRTQLGLLIGVVLGAVVAFGGFVAFVTVVLFGGVGLVVGLVLDGRLDLRSLGNSARR